MESLIGRKNETQLLQKMYCSYKSEFVAVYGRRRVGKTYLIREVFKGKMTFEMTGIANVGTSDQLSEFYAELKAQAPKGLDTKAPKTWFEAFRLLRAVLEKSNQEKKVVFLDELPWMDTRGSKFIPALEHFWNAWASARKDILLIVCGSAASWMIKNLLNNRGGLHNRVTQRIKLEPFNLFESEQFLKNLGFRLDRYQLVQLYMVFGGIPFYLEKLDSGQSALQNINTVCFGQGAPFRSEFDNLYGSLFKNSENHIQIIEALSTKNKGLTREELIRIGGFSNGGGLTRILRELEESSFIRKYRSFGKKEKNSLYQLIDLYSLFYLNFIKKSNPEDKTFWLNANESPMYRAWGGYAFEMVCLHHAQQIKEALRIGAVQSNTATWRSETAQIDLLIDRADRVINLCEMKFSIYPFSITKAYAEKLRHKIGSFVQETKTNKSVFLTFISSFGLSENKYSGMVQNDLKMDVLFKELPSK